MNFDEAALCLILARADPRCQVTIGREGFWGRRIRHSVFISACLDREREREDLRCLRTEISEFRDVLNEGDLRGVDIFTGRNFDRSYAEINAMKLDNCIVRLSN